MRSKGNFYIRMADRRRTLDNFFDRSSYLYEEPGNLLKQELREPAIYNAIIKAIAEGASRMNDIKMKVGEENSVVSKYLKTLIDLGIAKKETPITEKLGKKTIYLLADNFFRFWYRFVPKLLDYPVWYADYEELPQTPYRFSMWQYSSTGSVPGIEGNVDLNIQLLKK